MVRITIEPFLKNTLEFTDLRTTGARWRGRGYFWMSRYNQKRGPSFRLQKTRSWRRCCSCQGKGLPELSTAAGGRLMKFQWGQLQTVARPGVFRDSARRL